MSHAGDRIVGRGGNVQRRPRRPVWPEHGVWQGEDSMRCSSGFFRTRASAGHARPGGNGSDFIPCGLGASGGH